MDIGTLQSRLSGAAGCKAFLSALAGGGNHIWLKGLAASASAALFSSAYGKDGRTFLFILDDAEDAGYFYHDLKQSLGEEAVLYFPSSYRRAIKYGHKDAANGILRTQAMARLGSGQSACIVSYPEAISEFVPSPVAVDRMSLAVEKGKSYNLAELRETMLEWGFEEREYVYEPGQFAVRGGIVDVYSYSCELPFRIDFFGDEVDSIRTFEVRDQLSVEMRERVEIVPELPSGGGAKSLLLEFLPGGSVLAARDLSFVAQAVQQVYDKGFSSQAVTAMLETSTEVEQEAALEQMRKGAQIATGAEFLRMARLRQVVEFGHTPSGVPSDTVEYHTEQQPLFHKNFDLLKSTISDYRSKAYNIYILSDSRKQQQRLLEIVCGEDGCHNAPFEPVDGALHGGYLDHDNRMCIFTDHQVFDRFHKYNLRSDKARAGKMALTLKEIQQMEPGDFVVHVDLGVGKFGGLVRVPSPSGYQEVIRIIYQRGDKVDISIHALHKVSKYRSGDTGEPPRLSTLGTGAWDRLKERAKKRIKDIARDLIRLYAKRRHEKGFAFSADTYMQQELEASFLYEDTPDQLKATQDIKADMEATAPMDRLVCGDVGFGKTELAVRAAFKAACDGKQTAVLVPTTVLAFQHYKTFKSRLKNMPVRVEYLSRARTATQTKALLSDLAAGKVDIMVGTHKLIGKGVVWHDLGMLIIDEEQKFGVAVKERLRKAKTNIDTLTMSATPIPRTLQFSLMGARDMSVMRTPPPNRHPISTEVVEFSADDMAEAVNFEMSRNGQVFIVSNRISSLGEIRDMLVRRIPDCRIAIGHGQMKPGEMEEVVAGFMDYEYDVLLSTTIVENGVDIPNANTIIINNAHRFGLSDLHQMRGRVGRGNRKAFCYLVAPPKAALPTEARRRLEALENFSDLGSGFAIAMQDLDIRGAGNLLGAEQSGFMEDLGYETYQKILSQAVAELKNEEFADMYGEGAAIPGGGEFVDECTIESDMEMYFPEDYVPLSSERMLLYRELDGLEDDAAVEAFAKRMQDRFGPMPKQGRDLMAVPKLRRMGKELGAEKIILKNGAMAIQFVSRQDSAYYKSEAFGKVIGYACSNPRECGLSESNGRRQMHVAGIATVGAAVEKLSRIGGAG